MLCKAKKKNKKKINSLVTYTHMYTNMTLYMYNITTL